MTDFVDFLLDRFLGNPKKNLENCFRKLFSAKLNYVRASQTAAVLVENNFFKDYYGFPNKTKKRKPKTKISRAFKSVFWISLFMANPKSRFQNRNLEIPKSGSGYQSFL